MNDVTRVLIIDDDIAAARLLELGLERNGPYQVCVENQSLRSCDIARSFRPHVILLDVVMPQLDGGEVAARLRAQPDLKQIPIIFLTSLIAGQETEQGMVNSGGYPFLAKPAMINQVIASIEEVVGSASPKPDLTHFRR